MRGQRIRTDRTFVAQWVENVQRLGVPLLIAPNEVDPLI